MSVTTALQNATRAIGSIISGSASEPEILGTLKQEHEEVGEMLKKLVDSESGTERKNLVAKIKAALLPHLGAEQKVLYDALIAKGDKKIQQDGQEGYVEHELAAVTLAKLEMISNAMSPEFSGTAKVLKELIEHHVQEEEKNIWSDAKDKFSADERVLMNHKYLAAKKLVGAPEKKPVTTPKKAVATTQQKTKAVTAKKVVVAASAKPKPAQAPKKAVTQPKKTVATTPKKASAPVKRPAAAKVNSRSAVSATI